MGNFALRLSTLPWILALLILAVSGTARADGGDPALGVAAGPAADDRPLFHLAHAPVLFGRQSGPAVVHSASESGIPLHETTNSSDQLAAADDLVFGDEAEEISDEDLADIFDDNQAQIVDDPLEFINRPMFTANLTLDRYVMRPITRVYVETVPEPGRNGLANLLDNFKSPVILINDLLQGEMSRAGSTFGRFFINTLLGFAGTVDVAEAMGLPGHDEDFGQTLASYGVGGKPYVVLPIFGPSNPRDAFGAVADTAIDPLTFLTPAKLKPAQAGAGILSGRERILEDTDTLEATSVDFYSAVRSFYYQNRNFEISNGREPPSEAEPAGGDLYDGLEQGSDEDLTIDPKDL